MLESIADKVRIAVERIRCFEPPDGYYLAFSGGKDSVVIKALCNRAGVKYDAHYNVTTIDPPDLVRFIREKHSDVVFDRPAKSFYSLVPSRGFPMRQNRWCCETFKEGGGKNRFVITGIRHLESNRRKARPMTEGCNKNGKRFLHPIIDWSEQDVWEFIKSAKIDYCCLYDEGWRRIGCVACPMATARQRLIELERYPKIRNAMINSFRKLYNNRKANGAKSVDRWESAEEMFDWWISNKGTAVDNDTTLPLF